MDIERPSNRVLSYESRFWEMTGDRRVGIVGVALLFGSFAICLFVAAFSATGTVYRGFLIGMAFLVLLAIPLVAFVVPARRYRVSSVGIDELDSEGERILLIPWGRITEVQTHRLFTSLRWIDSVGLMLETRLDIDEEQGRNINRLWVEFVEACRANAAHEKALKR